MTKTTALIIDASFWLLVCSFWGEGEEYIINIRSRALADVGNQTKEKCSLDWLVARNYSVLRTVFINTYRRQFRESLLQCGGAVVVAAAAAGGGRCSRKGDRAGRVKTS
jgi:hypothetical protein